MYFTSNDCDINSIRESGFVIVFAVVVNELSKNIGKKCCVVGKVK